MVVGLKGTKQLRLYSTFAGHHQDDGNNHQWVEPPLDDTISMHRLPITAYFNPDSQIEHETVPMC